MQEDAVAQSNNQYRGVTHSSKSDHKRNNKKISHNAQSNLAQENRTSHSEEDEMLQNKNNYADQRDLVNIQAQTMDGKKL